MRAKAFTIAAFAAATLGATAASASDTLRGVQSYQSLGPIEYVQGHLNGSVTFSTGPVYYQPAPVYRQPAPVYTQPAPVYRQPAPIVVDRAPRREAVRPGRQIRERLDRQANRIARADARGDLTRRELRRLERRDAEIRDAFRTARKTAGRGIDPREQGYLNAMLDEQSQRIRRLANNRRTAHVSAPRHDRGFGQVYAQPTYVYRP